MDMTVPGYIVSNLQCVHCVNVSLRETYQLLHGTILCQTISVAKCTNSEHILIWLVSIQQIAPFPFHSVHSLVSLCGIKPQRNATPKTNQNTLQTQLTLRSQMKRQSRKNVQTFTLNGLPKVALTPCPVLDWL